MNSSTPKAVIMAVVIILGLIVLAVVGGAVILAVMGEKSLPGEIVTIGAGSAGALGGLLASTRTTETGDGFTATTAQPDYTTTPIVAADHPAS